MTEKTMHEDGSLAALEQALERYGSDRTRWPAPVRRAVAGLLTENAGAQRRLAEAEALDRLLDLMPEPQVETRALADRIMAAVEAEQPAGGSAAPVARVAWARLARDGAGRETPWPAAALLAASLVLGAFIGLSSPLDTAFETVVVEASDETSTDPGQIAYDSDALGLFEEDLL
jgi:hypothetical protein